MTHQYCCETCKYHLFKKTSDICHFCNSPIITKEDKITQRIGVDEYYRICLLGCASHSNFQNDQIIDKLHKWFENYCEGNEEPDLWMAFIKAEQSFRQNKKEDEI